MTEASTAAIQPSPARTKRGYAAQTIHEDVQEPLRERLLFLRRARGLNRRDVKTLSAGTLQKFENDDLSTLKMGDLAGLAQEYAMSLPEMLMYLAAADTNLEGTRTEEGRRLQRMTVYMRNLPDDLQNLVIDMVGLMVGFHVDRAKLERQISHKVGARDIVREAIERKGT